MIHTRAILTSLICLYVAGAASAQKEPEPLSIKFRVLPWSSTAGEVYMQSGSSYELIKGMPNQVSHEYSYTGPNPFLLYRKTIGPENTIVHKPYSSLNIDPNVSRYLMVLYPDPQKKELRRGFLYPFDYSQEDGSPLVLFNMTDFPVKAQVGDKIVDLSAGQHLALSPKDVEGAIDNYALRCKLAGNDEGKWKLIYNDYIHTPPQSRVYFFIKQSQGGEGNRLKIQTKKIVDYRLSDATRKAASDNFNANEVIEIKPY